MNRRERATAGLGTLAPNVIVIPCLLKTQSPYLRRTYGYKAIGTKASVDCQMLVDRIEMETWMEHERFGIWLPPHRGFFAKATSARKLEPTNVRVKCKGREPTNWRAFSFAKVTYLGRDYFADVTSNERSVKCGA